MVPIGLVLFFLIILFCLYPTYTDIIAYIKLTNSKIPYEATDYKGDKQKLFHNRPSVYWSKKSYIRPFLVVTGGAECREALSKCVTKSDDMFLIHRQYDGLVKFGQLVIPVLPESILTNSKSNLRRELRKALNQVDDNELFNEILRLYEQEKEETEGVHLLIAMICISIWIDLEDNELLGLSRKTVDCFNFFYDSIIANAKDWLSTPCTREQKRVLTTMVDMVSNVRTKFRLDMSVNSMINIINAGHDAIYSAYLHLLKTDYKSSSIRLILKEHPNILAAGRHTLEPLKLCNFTIPANVDIIIYLKGVSAFSYGGKSCIAKASFAIDLLDFLLQNRTRFFVSQKELSMFEKLLLFIK